MPKSAAITKTKTPVSSPSKLNVSSNTAQQPSPELQKTLANRRSKRPGYYSPEDVLSLQRMVGNQAVLRLLGRSTAAYPTIPATSARLQREPDEWFLNDTNRLEDAYNRHLDDRNTLGTMIQDALPARFATSNDDTTRHMHYLAKLVKSNVFKLYAVTPTAKLSTQKVLPKDSYYFFPVDEAPLFAPSGTAILDFKPKLTTQYEPLHRGLEKISGPGVIKILEPAKKQPARVKELLLNASKLDNSSERAKYKKSFGMTTHLEALALHNEHRKTLDKIVKEGLAQTSDKRLKNTAEWLVHHNYSRLFALTLTHDNNRRLAALNADSTTEAAYFGYDKENNTGAAPLYDGTGGTTLTVDAAKAYNAAKTDKFNITVSSQGLGGFLNPVNGDITIVNPTPDRAENIKEVLKHETQHGSDFNEERSGATTPNFKGGNFEFLIKYLAKELLKDKIKELGDRAVVKKKSELQNSTFGYFKSLSQKEETEIRQAAENLAKSSELITPDVLSNLGLNIDSNKGAVGVDLQGLTVDGTVKTKLAKFFNEKKVTEKAQDIIDDFLKNKKVNNRVKEVVSISADIVRMQQAGLETFRTEMRAYALQGKHTNFYSEAKPGGFAVNKGSDAFSVSNYGDYGEILNFETDKKVTDQVTYRWKKSQWEIFKWLYEAAAGGSYTDVKKGWDFDDQMNTPGERKFQQAVLAFQAPLSVNPNNSVRVHELFKELKKIKADGAVTDDDLDNLKLKITTLHDDERQEIFNNPAFKTELKDRLGDGSGAYKYIRSLILGGQEKDKEANPYVDKNEQGDVIAVFSSKGLNQFYSVLQQIPAMGEPSDNQLDSLVTGVELLNDDDRAFILGNSNLLGDLDLHLGKGSGLLNYIMGLIKASFNIRQFYRVLRSLPKTGEPTGEQIDIIINKIYRLESAERKQALSDMETLQAYLGTNSTLLVYIKQIIQNANLRQFNEALRNLPVQGEPTPEQLDILVDKTRRLEPEEAQEILNSEVAMTELKSYLGTGSLYNLIVKHLTREEE